MPGPLQPAAPKRREKAAKIGSIQYELTDERVVARDVRSEGIGTLDGRTLELGGRTLSRINRGDVRLLGEARSLRQPAGRSLRMQSTTNEWGFAPTFVRVSVTGLKFWIVMFRCVEPLPTPPTENAVSLTLSSTVSWYR